MREDMYKVIVERPRMRTGFKGGENKDGRRFRNHLDPDEDGGNAARVLGMRAGYRRRKFFNENLAPLRRWLAAQAGRKWDEVYSEIANGIDRRSTVQQHIFQHIEDFVAVHVVAVNNAFVVFDRWRGRVSIGESLCILYVDPGSGVLLCNVARTTKRQRRLEQAKRDKREDRKILGFAQQLHRIAGIWYLIEISMLPSDRQWTLDPNRPRDSMIHEQVSTDNAERRRALYGDGLLYASSKRQLSRKEKQKFGVVDLETGTSRSFFCPGARDPCLIHDGRDAPLEALLGLFQEVVKLNQDEQSRWSSDIGLQQ